MSDFFDCLALFFAVLGCAALYIDWKLECDALIDAVRSDKVANK